MRKIKKENLEIITQEKIINIFKKLIDIEKSFFLDLTLSLFRDKDIEEKENS